MSDDRPPAYPSKSRLAHELDCAESTIDELVRKGILPKPIRLTSGCVRWDWNDVNIALASLKTAAASGDPYLDAVAQQGDEQQTTKKKRR
jgi:predicted DNA-binding transcriptional regulator AlpA